MLRIISSIAVAFVLLASLSACGGNSGAKSGDGVPAGQSGGGSTADSGGKTGGGTSSGAGAAAGNIDAKAIFKANCVACHGVNLQGGIGPNLQKIGSKISADRIRNQITNGGGGMPSFKKLGSDKINALTVWLEAKK